MMQKEYDLNLLTTQLASFELKKFLQDVDHQNELMERTVNQRKLGSRLGFHFDTVNIYMAYAANGDKNFHMYEHMTNVLADGEQDTGKFLKALEKSGNEHIIIYIKKVMDENCQEGKNTMTTTNEHPASSSSISSASSSASCSTSTERKLKAQVVSTHFKIAPFKQFLEPHLVYLCENTENVGDFILGLYQNEFFSRGEAVGLGRSEESYACKEIYQYAGPTGSGEKLVKALQFSQNWHILDKMYEWISP